MIHGLVRHDIKSINIKQLKVNLSCTESGVDNILSYHMCHLEDKHISSVHNLCAREDCVGCADLLSHSIELQSV